MFTFTDKHVVTDTPHLFTICTLLTIQDKHEEV